MTHPNRRHLSVIGPQLPFSDRLHAEKYRGEGETFREAMSRVASALSDNSDHFHAFRDILLDMRFLPAGRVQAAMGSTRNVTPYNCFVSGTIEDSFVEGSGSIMDRAKQAAATMRMGGGIGYDFSTLRPRGATIKKLASRSSGPVTFMEIYDAVCRCTASSGHRRGAQMGVLRIDHPDIEEFIRAKHNETRLTGFNVSVAVTDEFMCALELDEPFPLRFGRDVYKTVDPKALWNTLMRSTWDWAEPGVLFIDRINSENNLHYCEEIAATNPCGEQPLPPFGACLLGSFNMTRYLKPVPEGFEHGGWELDWRAFMADITPVVRAMDNIIDRATYPLYEQEKEAKSKRRMGLGVTGMANAIEAMGYPYGSEKYLTVQDGILSTLRNCAYLDSSSLAQEKGPFPLYDKRLLDSGFASRLTWPVRSAVEQHGLRNSHLISIAPTGTISLCADNVSSGIEPVFAHEVERLVMMSDGARTERFKDYGLAHFGVRGRTSAEVTVDEHLAVLTRAQRYVDSAVSKTCNVPPSTPWEDFKALYVKAWKAGAKGCTTFQTGGMRSGIMEDAAPVKEEEEPAPACRIDAETGRRECE